MTSIFDSDEHHFDVVVNHEGQYSIWPEGMDLPAGWTTVGVRGPKAECLKHIESVWTDMRPRSLVAQMQAQDAR